MRENDERVSQKLNVALIERSTWESSMTDDYRAWGYSYRLYFPDLDEIGNASTSDGYGHGWEECYPNWTIVPTTDEHRKRYDEIREEQFLALCEENLPKYQKELEDYNALLRPQEKGQVVKVMTEKGKHAGKIGKVSWFGNNQFKPKSRYTNWRQAAVFGMIDARPYTIPAKGYDLIRIVPLDGEFEPFYYDPAKCKVVAGYKPISVTLDDVIRFERRMQDNWKAYGGNYDHHKY